MGWTYKPATFYKNGKVDRKKELDHEFSETSECGTWEILKSTMVGTTYYAACKRTVPNEAPKTFAIIASTHIDGKDYYNFGYKDMTENMGPFQYDCPENILSLLSPTDNEDALQWRQACRDERKRKSAGNPLSKLPIGTVIRIEHGGKERELRKMAPAHQFKTPWWMFLDKFAYLPKNRIPSNYVVVA